MDYPWNPISFPAKEVESHIACCFEENCFSASLNHDPSERLKLRTRLDFSLASPRKLHTQQVGHFIGPSTLVNSDQKYLINKGQTRAGLTFFLSFFK